MNPSSQRSISVVLSFILLLSVSPAAFAGRTREVTLEELDTLLRDRARSSSRRRSNAPARRAPAERRQTRPASSLVMPVAGVTWDELQDSFGDPRSGGRSHMGIDIFAPRWTEVVAAAAGTLTAIDFGERSGRSLWLVGHDGRAYFYAHLQGWANGIHDGQRVSPGEVVGYVGNTGNASASPTHLHFEVRDQGRVVNPYAVLARAEPVGGPVHIATRPERASRR